VDVYLLLPPSCEGEGWLRSEVESAQLTPDLVKFSRRHRKRNSWSGVGGGGGGRGEGEFVKKAVRE
jgi:hypothetical protein